MAISQLDGVGHGARETAMQDIARRLSGHTDTSAMRRAIAAHQFLERLREEEPASYVHLESAPLSIVEVIARWATFDPPAAFLAAAQWAKGIGNVSSIRDAMRDARPAGYAGKSGIALERAYVADAKFAVTRAVQKLTDDPGATLLGSLVRDLATGQMIDFVFELPNRKSSRLEQEPFESRNDGPKREVAVLVVGPYTNQKLYANKCSDWVTKAFGLALLYERIVLALPEATAVAEYQRRTDAILKRIAARSMALGPAGCLGWVVPVVNVVHTDVPKFLEEDEALLDRLT